MSVNTEKTSPEPTIGFLEIIILISIFAVLISFFTIPSTMKKTNNQFQKYLTTTYGKDFEILETKSPGRYSDEKRTVAKVKVNDKSYNIYYYKASLFGDMNVDETEEIVSVDKK